MNSNLKYSKLVIATAFVCAALLFPWKCPAQSSGARSGKAPSISVVPCEVPGAAQGAKEKALCGTHEVFEDRRGKKGRKIAIKIVIFPVTGATKQGDPLFYFP